MTTKLRANGAREWAETTGIIVLASLGLVVLGLVCVGATLIAAVWPKASKVGALHFDPVSSPPSGPIPPAPPQD